ncbi:uncharacterized protein LOC109432815 [Aedes albopictus]|uniref:Peptidase aspartic putative domain-containing protein n=1 Tax=Aedes albopictus TaxID=7160 RepID=A0ABM1YNJ6_AEDAL
MPSLRQPSTTAAYGNYQPGINTGESARLQSTSFQHNHQPRLSELSNTGPSPVQLAARQVMSRDLPKFSGDPEDWPIFLSAFQNTTQACGYSDAENLARLQRCLDGSALAAVKSRLLLPESVPFVISTLQRLFGRPEILIHSLLNKLREVPAPKADNLKTVIEFGLPVQDLVDHMQLSRLNDHLQNPMLLHELVEKLPATYKMQWSTFKRTSPVVNLSTFGSFMSELVNTASDVTLPDLSVPKSSKSAGTRNRSKLYTHTEDTPVNEELVGHHLSEQSVPKKCFYCSSACHEIQDCTLFKALDMDARWKAMRQNGLCRMCLVPHRRWPCRSAKECGIAGCRLRHHTLLHTSEIDRSSRRTGTDSSAPDNESVVHQNLHHGFPSTLFRYLPVIIKGMDETLVYTYAFLDDGSSSTLMEAAIATKLGVDGPADSLWLSWTGNVSREEKYSQRVSIEIAGQDGGNRFRLNNVRTVQKLNLPSQTLQYEDLRSMYPHLRGLPVQSYSRANPGIIIGMEHARLLATLKIREGKANDPVAAKTRLGWCIFGKQCGENQSVELLNHHSEMKNRELHEQMKTFFGIEEASITVKPEAEVDKRAKQIMVDTTRRVGKAFETGLIWKYDNISFPDSYNMAEKRLVQLEKRLSRNPALKEKVHEQIVEYEKKGYTHRLTEDERRSSDSSRVWYLPLGVVQNPKKPHKVRLIWDAAARVGGTSFNDMLLKGPDLLTLLTAILLRFRQRNIALCGDIREMFHQIFIRNADKQAQRFLWRSSSDSSPQIFVMDVATFGATCSPSSAQFVKNVNAKEFASEYPDAADAIINSHYVDDYLDSVDTVDQAVQRWNEVKYVHSQAGFEIRNFISNSADVLRRVGVTGGPESKSLNLDQTEQKERVLGMVWKPVTDEFTFESTLQSDIAKPITEQTIPTKRQVLRTIMSLFDPLGLIAHFVVQGKILMQDIWRSGTDWDEPIAENLQAQWSKWSRTFTDLNNVQVPRCFFSNASQKALRNTQIHVFVDASAEAYACVAYLRIVDYAVPRCALAVTYSFRAVISDRRRTVTKRVRLAHRITT